MPAASVSAGDVFVITGINQFCRNQVLDTIGILQKLSAYWSTMLDASIVFAHAVNGVAAAGIENSSVYYYVAASVAGVHHANSAGRTITQQPRARAFEQLAASCPELLEIHVCYVVVPLNDTRCRRDDGQPPQHRDSDDVRNG